MKIQISPLKVDSFEQMNLSPALLKALGSMKIVKPTEVQSKTIPEALVGTDLIGVAQTGSGKTLAFALPLLSVLEKNPQARALILAPSREMAQQIFKVISELCAELPMSTGLIIGGIPSAKQIAQLRKNPRIIIATPGRLNDHLVNNKLLLQNVEFIVIDEADRMLDMGFTPQLKSIQSTLRGARQTLMFSATFNPAVENIAQVYMKASSKIIRSSQSEEPVAELQQKVLLIDKFKKNDRLLDELNATKGGVIVFCGNQGSCERLYQYLQEYGYSVDMIHGGVTQGQRNRVVREFREGELRIVVATDLLARGIDIPHVDHVINFELPFQAEDFLHRIGRTARAGRVGNAITFVTPSDSKMYTKIKPYLEHAKIIKVDPNFNFTENTRENRRGSKNNFSEVSRRSPTQQNQSNYDHSKKIGQKKTFDGSKKIADKPISKTIGSLNKPNQQATKPRNDKYLSIPRSGKGKPSVWKNK